MCTGNSANGGQVPGIGGISQNIAGLHGVSGVIDPFNDPLGLLRKPPAPPGVEIPEDINSSEFLNEQNYAAEQERLRMMRAGGMNSTLLTGPTGIKPGAAAPSSAPTLLGAAAPGGLRG